jgi:hypothetical protein
MQKTFAYGTPQSLSSQDLTNQLQEALVMAGMVSLRNDLSVQLGDWWTFNWKTNVISLPEAELERCPKEEVCWIILHEAAHAALTRLHDILPRETLQRPELQLLLNCVEDVRIENWILERFPGSAPWKSVAETMSRVHDPATAEEAEQEHPARAFLRGIVRLGRNSGMPVFLHPLARAALEEALPSLESAFACVPPGNSVDNATVSPIYRRHPVALCYAGFDQKQEPSAMEKWVRIMQASMWSHVSSGVLPVFLRLIKQFGCPQNNLQRTIRVTHSDPAQGPQRSHEELQKALRSEFENGGAGRYLETVHKYDAQIRAITELLQKMLPNHRGLQHVRGRRSGDRLDLRVAAQFEADQSLYQKLWLRREKQTLPEPAFMFVMDHSSSMRHEGKSQAAFESLVLIREACTRVGIPFYVSMFNVHAEVIHGWDQLADTASEAALSAILKTCGGTSISEALKDAAEEINQRHERDRFIFLMTDGEVSDKDREAVLRRLERLSQEDIRVVPFGLGLDSEQIIKLFPEAELVPEACEFPMALSRSLLRVLGQFSA